ncbi:thiamine phosphate synthase [Sphingomonas oleivorans]|uniref:Thiamine phosphate synthase n=2 Tax=Sphingomonas oleivorans TaxID=1735121 RepID=A0A2T5G2Q4_9SPHN|nr:thiamine phosphate synthase [Sphingomonas oleivorans]
MTDERLGDGLWQALARLPRGSGVVFRHHATPAGERRRLFDAIRRMSRARGLLLLLAGPPALAAAWGADGTHGRYGARRAGRQIRSVPVHDGREMTVARRIGADLVFVSPLHATRSHPGAAPLGRSRFGLLARYAPCPVVALGGMTRRRAGEARALGAYGWAAIDGLRG